METTVHEDPSTELTRNGLTGDILSLLLLLYVCREYPNGTPNLVSYVSFGVLMSDRVSFVNLLQNSVVVVGKTLNVLTTDNTPDPCPGTRRVRNPGL